MISPVLEPEFKPAIIELRNYFKEVNTYKNKEHLIVSIERANGFIYHKEFDILPKGVDDKRNIFIVERLIKCLLWVVGGFKIYIAGPHYIYEKIKEQKPSVNCCNAAFSAVVRLQRFGTARGRLQKISEV